MFTEDSLATAEIAKIFGSELLHVQEKARTDAGMQPEILKMHPKQFLGASPQQQQVRRQEEALLIQRLQREAEATHPLPQMSLPQNPPPLPVEHFSAPASSQPIQHVVAPSFDSDELKKLNVNLDRIATILEKSIELFAKVSANQ